MCVFKKVIFLFLSTVLYATSNMIAIKNIPKRLCGETQITSTNSVLFYRIENLDVDQRKFFEIVKNRRNKCILLQSGPGSGKTFTLLTISNNLQLGNEQTNQLSRKITTVIYKNDLLTNFNTFTQTLSNASFFMKLFKLNYFAYKSFSDNASTKLSPIETLFMIIDCLNVAKIELFSENLMIFDEYTVLPKLLLFVILVLCDHYDIQAIFSCDRNQLQTIERKKQKFHLLIWLICFQKLILNLIQIIDVKIQSI